jgi:hypothetical protein
MKLVGTVMLALALCGAAWADLPARKVEVAIDGDPR